jgi:hypothetical protein
MGFTGTVVSDYNGIGWAESRQLVASSREEVVALGVAAGMDVEARSPRLREGARQGWPHADGGLVLAAEGPRHAFSPGALAVHAANRRLASPQGGEAGEWRTHHRASNRASQMPVKRRVVQRPGRQHFERRPGPNQLSRRGRRVRSGDGDRNASIRRPDVACMSRGLSTAPAVEPQNPARHARLPPGRRREDCPPRW